MGLLYRFRRCRDQSITNVINLTIEGSKYTEMADEKEVSLFVDSELIKNKTKFPEGHIGRIQEIIRKHILNSYFIACFSKTDQTSNISMWKEYADYDGFCLVYREEQIRKAIKYAMWKLRNIYLMLRDVDYGTEPTDITSFVFDYLQLIGNDFENEKTHKYASKYVDNKLLTSGRNLIKSMFHKIGTFPEDDEMRIVLLGKENNQKYNNNMVSVAIKPFKIICSSLMPDEKRKRLERFAKKNNITFLIKEIKRQSN